MAGIFDTNIFDTGIFDTSGTEISSVQASQCLSWNIPHMPDMSSVVALTGSYSYGVMTQTAAYSRLSPVDVGCVD